MESSKLLQKDVKESLSALRQKKKDKKRWKEKKLLKKLDSKNLKSVIPDCSVAKSERKKCHMSTLSIAVPGSILDNAQSAELRTYLAGQIARAACIFNVDEIVVFDDMGGKNIADKDTDKIEDGRTIRHCCIQLARILQYLECPQYLRKYFFPIHKDLKFAGLLNPLDAPHHLRQNDEFIFREGVTTNLPAKANSGSVVNCGLLKDVTVDKNLTPGIRVTVKILPQPEGSKKLRGEIVPPSLPSVETGTYWGYTVRIADTLSDVFTKSPYSKGYDLTIGTSEKGDKLENVPDKALHYKHVIIVFGGLQGLEAALDNDESLTVDDPALLFDHYLNTCPHQGSRTIRTEEAILISLAVLQNKLCSRQALRNDDSHSV